MVRKEQTRGIVVLKNILYVREVNKVRENLDKLNESGGGHVPLTMWK